jgi:hypothetical protein
MCCAVERDSVAHLEGVMAQLEYNDMLHAKILVHEMHALCTLQI